MANDETTEQGTDAEIDAALAALEAEAGPAQPLAEQSLADVDMSERVKPADVDGLPPEGLDVRLDPLIDALRDVIGDL
jgi:hypothetical protein